MGKKFGYQGNVDDFAMLAEGTYIFNILSAEFIDAKDAVKVSCATKDGKKHTQYFNLVKNNGEVNDTQVKAVIRLCAAALQDDSLKKEQFDTDWLGDLKGKYFQAEIQHNEYQGKTRSQFNPFAFTKAYGFVDVADAEDDLDNL